MSKAGTYLNSQSMQSLTLDSMQELRILLADDSAVNQRIGLGLLDKLGYLADAVSDGMEVFVALECIRYHVILMDCEMPKLDGYETTRRIRELEQKRTAPFDRETPIHIIAMTANTMEGDREKCLAAGMNDYLCKPVRRNELETALKALLQIDSLPAATSHNDTISTGAAASAEVMVDIERLRDVTDDDPVRMQRLIELYLTQTAPSLDQLEAAIRANSGANVASLAHKIIGSSVSCGVVAFTTPLRQLERLGHAGDLSGASALLQEIQEKFPRLQSVFAGMVKAPQPA